VTTNLPQGAGLELEALVEQLTGQLTESLLARRTGYTVAGAVVLFAVAARLAASLRVALREIFDIGAKRKQFHGLLFDFVAVLVAFVLLTAKLGITVFINYTVAYGQTLFGLGGPTFSTAQWLLGLTLSFVSIWVLLFLLYRFVPARPIKYRTAIVAATFAAIAHEALKTGFSWYATEVANYGSALGNIATVAVFFFWIYYESLVFILGGEVAQVSTMRKASRVGVVTFEEES
jgi:membrane protein